MNFGLDYDGTVSAEKHGFMQFCKLMRSLGHKVYITTMRYPSECIEIFQQWSQHVDGVFATGREAKKPWMDAKGIDIHIWIDDNARAIHESASEIWGHSTPEGVTHTPVHNPEPPKELRTKVMEFPYLLIRKLSDEVLPAISGCSTAVSAWNVMLSDMAFLGTLNCGSNTYVVTNLLTGKSFTAILITQTTGPSVIFLHGPDGIINSTLEECKAKVLEL